MDPGIGPLLFFLDFGCDLCLLRRQYRLLMNIILDMGIPFDEQLVEGIALVCFLWCFGFLLFTLPTLNYLDDMLGNLTLSQCQKIPGRTCNSCDGVFVPSQIVLEEKPGQLVLILGLIG